MHLLKEIADVVGRLAHLFVPGPSEPERPMTEDDIASDRFARRQQDRTAPSR